MSADLIPTLGPQTRLKTAPQVRSREIGGEAVLLDLEAGTYFGLNAAGAVVWKCVERSKSLGEVHAALTGHFEVDAERAWADLVELIGNLLDRGLVTVEPAGGAS